MPRPTLYGRYELAGEKAVIDSYIASLGCESGLKQPGCRCLGQNHMVLKRRARVSSKPRFGPAKLERDEFYSAAQNDVAEGDARCGHAPPR